MPRGDADGIHRISVPDELARRGSPDTVRNINGIDGAVLHLVAHRVHARTVARARRVLEKLHRTCKRCGVGGRLELVLRGEDAARVDRDGGYEHERDDHDADHDDDCATAITGPAGGATHRGAAESEEMTCSIAGPRMITNSAGKISVTSGIVILTGARATRFSACCRR